MNDRVFHISSTLNEDDEDREITEIYICAYATEDKEGNERSRPPSNHWAAFFAFENGNSIKVEIVPGHGSDGLSGMITLKSKAYKYTDKSIKTFSFDLEKSQTISDILEIIYDNNLDRYKFTKGGEGARFWMYELLQHLEHYRCIELYSCGYDEWVSKVAYDNLSKYWVNQIDSEPRPPMKKGTFYGGPSWIHHAQYLFVCYLVSLLVAWIARKTRATN